MIYTLYFVYINFLICTNSCKVICVWLAVSQSGYMDAIIDSSKIRISEQGNSIMFLLHGDFENKKIIMLIYD